MDMSTSLKFCSFNCKGFKYRNFDYIKKLFGSVDVILLQEHWLYEFESNKFHEILPDCQVISKSGMKNDCVNIGRPYGGVAILWKRSNSIKVESIATSSDRLCAAKITNNISSAIIFNVYMPCNIDGDTNDEFFLTYFVKLLLYAILIVT